MSCCNEKKGLAPCNRCDSGHTCGKPAAYGAFQVSHLSDLGALEPQSLQPQSLQPQSLRPRALRTGGAMKAALNPAPIAYSLQKNGLKETLSGAWNLYKTVVIIRMISVPVAFGLSYTRNRSIWLGFWQGLVFPELYLGYRGVQAATEKGK